jgi:putative oxidoreductase
MVDQTQAETRPGPTWADSMAAANADLLLLAGRIMIGWLFFKAGWDKLWNMGGFAGYLTNLGVPAPGLMAWPAMGAEILIGLGLILGIATRYLALACFAYLIIATGLAHRWWEYPIEQQGNQFNHFQKNLAIMGGALLVFVAGAGRYAAERLLNKEP